MKKPSVAQLEEIARQLRIDILKMVHHAKCGHTGGPLSCIDLLTALYFYQMNIDPKNPLSPDRDRFVLSAGHTAPALYAILMRLGYIPKEEIFTLRKLGSVLQGHPKMHPEMGIEMSTGSLGQGMSISNGMALAARVDQKNYRVYSLESDGGSQEGMMWEGAMAAAFYKLDNRCALLDYNNVQIDGFVSDVMDVAPLDKKFESFGWNVIVIDGHKMAEIVCALDEAQKVKGKPTVIIGKTILGKGVSLFENKPKYHGVAPTDDELEVALKELNG
ncbi:MAG TPA: transketolase [Deltaproteobacteria bacterium]|nr:MAG: transketolase [Deltaproteobacteria bacterium GWA2_45_12]HBF13736.1 transketolase [Deltaproteobacteria bacterium]